MIEEKQIVITQADGGFLVEVCGKLHVANNLRKALAIVKDTFGEEKEGE